MPVRRLPGGGGRRCWADGLTRSTSPAGTKFCCRSGAGRELPPAAVGQPSRPRLQLTDLPRENPAEPPMFCMLLRKYLAGEKSWPSASPRWSVWRSWLSRPPMRWGQSPPPSGVGSHGPPDQPAAVGRGGPDCGLPAPGGGDPDQARPLLPGMFYQYPAPSRGRRTLGPSPPPTGRSCWRWERGGPGGPVSPGSLHGPVAPAGPGAGL
ncbi:MAG: NFACT family protein [Evtepia gabavorous]